MRILAARCVRVLISCPSQPEGAGNAGGALHPRSHTQMEKGAHEHTGSAEAPGIPCVAALRLMPRSPRRRIRLVTVVGGFLRSFQPGRVWTITADLAPATGVRTTRFCRTLETSLVLRAFQYRSRGSTRPATALARRRSRVHHIPSRVRDDRDTPLLPERDGRP